MRLPGTRYQEHGWEHVRKLLGRCSLQAFAQGVLAHLGPADPETQAAALDLYTDLVAEALRAQARTARAAAPGNSYGDSVGELALSLLYELQARPADWAAMCAALRADRVRGDAVASDEALLRKKVNDMYCVVRDKVDADNYQAACGRPCSPNRIYTYRMLDTAYGEIARLFAAWAEHAGQVGVILDRPPGAMPIEVRQMRGIAQCRPEWIIRWSASLERFGAGPGPLHTRSKRFSSLRNNPEQIAAMLAEIGDYEELSANRDHAWQDDSAGAAAWLDALDEVLAAAPGPGPDQLLASAADDCADAEAQPEAEPEPDLDPVHDRAAQARESAAALHLSLPPRFMQLARAAQDGGSWVCRMLQADSLPVRLAVYLKLLGGADDSYPPDWLDPATGELPTMAQLAVLDDVSLPTLRKRRDAAIARLTGAARP